MTKTTVNITKIIKKVAAICVLDKLNDMLLYNLSKYIEIIAPIREQTVRIEEIITLLSIFFTLKYFLKIKLFIINVLFKFYCCQSFPET